MKKAFSWRKLFNDVHLWLGIASGLVIFIVCLTGTIYTFRTEVEEALEPSKYHVVVPADTQVIPTDELIDKLQQEYKGKLASIEIPEDKSRAYIVGIKGPDKESRPETLYLDPYTGHVLGGREGPATEFFGTVMKMHRWLLIEGDVGKIIVGTATIIFIFMLLSGIVLWWPIKLKNWKQGFKIKTSGKWKRTNHDLHNTLGFYSFILLLIMALTGLCWSFDWYREGLSKVMGAEVFKGRKEKPLPSAVPAPGATTLAVSEFIQRANAILPENGDIRVVMPADSASSVVVSKTQKGFFALAASDKVQLDQYTAETLKVEIFADKALNEQIVSQIKPLHLGEIYGTFSKILYFLACLVATSLPVTGTIIWVNKLRKKPKNKKRATAVA